MRKPTRYTAKDGTVTWRVRYRVPTKKPGGKDGSTSQSFGTEREASRFAQLLDVLGPDGALDQLEVEIRGAGIPTLDEIASDHIRLLTSIEDGTRLSYERLWARTWGQSLGHLPVNLITKDRIAEATQTLARTYSAKSLKNQRGLLSAVCGRAVEAGLLPTNPTTKLRLPRAKEHERVEMRLLTTEELEAIIANANPNYRTLIRFLADTGCRWGEAAALDIASLSLDAQPYPSAHIRQALKWSPDNARTIGPTKTRRSNRRIPLTDTLVDELRAITAGRTRTELVFTAPRGGPVQHRTWWSDVWLKALDAAAIAPPRPRPHDLRHSFASRALAAGTPLHVVQQLMGHENISTTVDTYGHLAPDALSQAVQAMQSVALSRAVPTLPPAP